MLATEIFEKSKGLPSFVIAIASSLLHENSVVIEEGVLVVKKKSFSVPTSLSTIIISRIDRLAPSAQVTLKVASIIGTRFENKLLCDIHPNGSSRVDVARDIAELLGADLIVPEDEEQARALVTHAIASRCGTETDSSTDITSDVISSDGVRRSTSDILNLSFCFKSEVVRDTVYENLTFSMRAKLHLKVVEWYEFSYSGDLIHISHSLAQHCRACGKMKKALQYFDEAADYQFSQCNYTACAKACHEIISHVESEADKEGKMIEISDKVIHALRKKSYLRLGVVSRAIESSDSEPIAHLYKGIQLVEAFALTNSTLLAVARLVDAIVSVSREKSYQRN